MKIIFYDGKCGLCQRSIQFIFKADKDKTFYFAPLNGVTYKDIYGNALDPLSTLKLFNENKTSQKSTAILEILSLLGGKYKYLYILKVIPIFIRDYLYDKVAFRRNAVTCLILENNNHFLN